MILKDVAYIIRIMRGANKAKIVSVFSSEHGKYSVWVPNAQANSSLSAIGLCNKVQLSSYHREMGLSTLKEISLLSENNTTDTLENQLLLIYVSSVLSAVYKDLCSGDPMYKFIDKAIPLINSDKCTSAELQGILTNFLMLALSEIGTHAPITSTSWKGLHAQLETACERKLWYPD